jgi:hypothetical protein
LLVLRNRQAVDDNELSGKARIDIIIFSFIRVTIVSSVAKGIYDCQQKKVIPIVFSDALTDIRGTNSLLL